MTNTRMTDAEIFEKRFPIILREFSIRAGSGGQGRNKGGDGVHREFEFIVPTSVSDVCKFTRAVRLTLCAQAAVIGERRVNAPYGLHGGEPGQRGCAYWMRRNTDGSLRKTKMKPSQTIDALRGERLVIHTPGGGGYGSKKPTSETSKKVYTNGSHMNGSTPTLNHKTTFYPRANGSINAYQSAGESSQ